jgi:hypothetical protein
VRCCVLTMECPPRRRRYLRKRPHTVHYARRTALVRRYRLRSPPTCPSRVM